MQVSRSHGIDWSIDDRLSIDYVLIESIGFLMIDYLPLLRSSKFWCMIQVNNQQNILLPSLICQTVSSEMCARACVNLKTGPYFRPSGVLTQPHRGISTWKFQYGYMKKTWTGLNLGKVNKNLTRPTRDLCFEGESVGRRNDITNRYSINQQSIANRWKYQSILSYQSIV